MPEDHGRDQELDARESARNRRRDQDADAAGRDLMRPGMGKVFKQIRDAQARAARDDARPATKHATRAARGKGAPRAKGFGEGRRAG